MRMGQTHTPWLKRPTPIPPRKRGAQLESTPGPTCLGFSAATILWEARRQLRTAYLGRAHRPHHGIGGRSRFRAKVHADRLYSNYMPTPKSWMLSVARLRERQTE